MAFSKMSIRKDQFVRAELPAPRIFVPIREMKSDKELAKVLNGVLNSRSVVTLPKAADPSKEAGTKGEAALCVEAATKVVAEATRVVAARVEVATKVAVDVAAEVTNRAAGGIAAI